MRHRRGIELLFPGLPPGADKATIVEHDGVQFDTFRQWELLGGKCVRCPHYGWIDRRILERKWPDNHFLLTLQRYLRCTKCQNKGDNRFIIGKMSRD